MADRKESRLVTVGVNNHAKVLAALQQWLSSRPRLAPDKITVGGGASGAITRDARSFLALILLSTHVT